ncbi:hypothetical protein [Novosphingobium sp. ES2-1]|uniref:hypothetical protein n=1 Tax=Novosphingobium sp. ES2-1 TaxID=2780074 RepID=UPI00187E96C0|nr:hypothetical protein [Novosphingobium sp. ES2-1]QOV92583.1 hypothetical protein IM701_07665 [Novosphingobium sp. ES2-1]
MDDLVERLRDAGYVLVSPGFRKLAHEAAAHIQALETSLAEAEGRVIAEVVAWCLREMYEPFTPLERAKALKSIATALETGEWKK